MKKQISKQDLQKVKELDLLTYLKNYEPHELIQNGRTDFVTRSHGSLHISNGLWCWWSKGIGGKSALDYLIKVEGWSFLEAALYINNLIERKPPAVIQKKYKKPSLFRLPQSAENDNQAIHYLVKERCIDKDIVKYCKEQRLFYEAKNDHSVIFIGYDTDRVARYACKRAINSNWKSDIAGSDKAYSFSITNTESSNLYVFESVIDLLSYMTFLKQKGKPYQNNNYLSLGGASLLGKSIEESNIPIALETFLKNHDNIQCIHLCLDNDPAGKDTAQKIIYHYQNKYPIFDEHPTKYKDYNEWLKEKKHYKKALGERY